MEIPNEIAAAIFTHLTACEKIRFASTCRTYKSFVPEGFPAFARKFSSVVAEINSIKHLVFGTAAVIRQYKGRRAIYNLGRCDLYVAQHVTECKITQSQAQRYATKEGRWVKINKTWAGSGLTVFVEMCWDAFKTGAGPLTEYSVRYVLKDNLQ